MSVQKLVSCISDGAILFNRDGEITFVNDILKNVVGDCRYLNFGDEILEELFTESTYVSNQKIIEFNLGKFEGLKGVLLSFEKTGVLLIDIDSIELELTSEKLFDKKYHSLKHNIFTLINHELRTPMNGMLGGIQILRSILEDGVESVDKDEFASIGRIVENSSEDFLKKVDRLISVCDLYGENSLESDERIKLIAIVNKAIDSEKEKIEEKNIRLNLKFYVDDEVYIYGAEDWLIKVFIEVIDNAVNQTSKDAVIDIVVTTNNYFVRVCVRDYGKNDASKIENLKFEPFEKVKDEGFVSSGLGIGLSISKMIIEKHSGNFRMQNKNNGVELDIELPIYKVKKKLSMQQQLERYAEDITKMASSKFMF